MAGLELSKILLPLDERLLIPDVGELEQHPDESSLKVAAGSGSYY
jgi:hypothetical protein